MHANMMEYGRTRDCNRIEVVEFGSRFELPDCYSPCRVTPALSKRSRKIETAEPTCAALSPISCFLSFLLSYHLTSFTWRVSGGWRCSRLLNDRVWGGSAFLGSWQAHEGDNNRTFAFYEICFMPNIILYLYIFMEQS